MKGLYKGKYLIAIYDDNDFLVDVVSSPKELKGYKNENAAKSYIAHVFNGRECKNIHFIDVTEKHNDIFAEEDELFLQDFKQNNKSVEEIVKQLGVCVRTYYKHKAKGTLYRLENKKEVDMKLTEIQQQLDEQKYLESQKWQKDMSGSMPYCKECEFRDKPFLACRISHEERVEKKACEKAAKTRRKSNKKK